MKTNLIFAAGLAVAAFLTGCETIPPGAERGPHRTIAYDVLVEASEPGARIEANGEMIGNTPVHLKIFGDTDGTFHDFGSFYYVVRAFPLTTNQFPQAHWFRTGREFTPEDRIPKHIYFDMNQKFPPYGPPGEPPYAYPGYGPPGYYYGPPFRFYFGPVPAVVNRNEATTPRTTDDSSLLAMLPGWCSQVAASDMARVRCESAPNRMCGGCTPIPCIELFPIKNGVVLTSGL